VIDFDCESRTSVDGAGFFASTCVSGADGDSERFRDGAPLNNGDDQFFESFSCVLESAEMNDSSDQRLALASAIKQSSDPV
jgi:hypothetical protein